MKFSNLPMTLAVSQKSNEPSWRERIAIKCMFPFLKDCEGSLLLHMPSGYQYCFGKTTSANPKTACSEPVHAVVILHTLKPLIKLLLNGVNGWSDAYLDSEWDTPNLLRLMTWSLKNEQALKHATRMKILTKLGHKLKHQSNNNTKRGSRKNIAAHYDLGNNFFKEWLDPGMTYSAGLFTYSNQTLAQAQTEKYQRILELLNPRESDQIIEIGCGWGEFAKHAVTRKNVQLQGITLSEHQLAWGQEKLKHDGLDNKAKLQLMDYRDISRQYDGAVSIEMFEAVGEQHWDTYFNKLKNILKPKAKAVLQIITIDDERFYSYRKNPDFIQRCVFPGGMLPSVRVLKEKFSQHGFSLEHQQMFGQDYAQTLKLWWANFESRWPAIAKQGFDQRFYRLWRYYFAYCQSGFEQQTIDVGLFVIKKRH